MEFAYPNILWLFLVFVPLIVWYIIKQRNAWPAMGLSSNAPFASLPTSFRAACRHILFVLNLLAIGFIIIALARPQTRDSWDTTSVEGTDIVIALDVSPSMLARDFPEGRLEAAKKVASDFVKGRENDNLGIVVFAGESLTGVPLTSDREAVVSYINNIKQNMLGDATAVGDGIATSINRIKDGKAVSKSIILITDGTNNTGIVDPITAAEIAADRNIKVYTIGIGTRGEADYPVYDYFGRLTYVKAPVEIDEATLQNIAEITGGQYFRATDQSVLNKIFNEINKLETSQIDVRKFNHTEDNFELWVALALGCLLLQVLLRQTWLRTMP